MTVTKKQILPALHKSDKVKNPDMPSIEDKNYASTILKYGNLALPFPQLDTNAKTIVAAINELYHTKSTVIPNPPGEEPTDTLNTVKIDGTVFNIEGGGGGTGVSGYDIKHYVGTNAETVVKDWDVDNINTYISKGDTHYQAIEFPICTTDQFKFKNDTDVKIDTELNLDIYIPWAIILSNGSEPFKDINFGYELRQYIVDEDNNETRIADYAPQEFLFEDAVQFHNDYSVYGGTQYTLSDRTIAGYNIREYFGEFSFFGGVTAKGRRQGGEIIEWDYYRGVNDALIWTYYFYKTPYSEYDYYDTKHYSYWLSSDYYGRPEDDTSKAIPAKRFELFRIDGGDTIPGIIAHDPVIYKLDVEIPVSWHLVDNGYNEPNHKPITCYYQFQFQYSDDDGETWFALNPGSYYGEYPTYMWEWKGTPENPEPEKRETISYTWFIDGYHLPKDDTNGFILRGDILVSAVPQDTYDTNSFPCELHFGVLPEALVTFTVVDNINYNKEPDRDVLVYTQTFYTDAPDENGESVTICEIDTEDLPEGDFFNVSINCEPDTGIYIGYLLTSRNTYRVYCQDYVPEGTPIKINYLYYEEGGSGSGSGSGSDESVSGSCVPEDTFPGHLNLTISRDFYKLLQKSNQYILPNNKYRVKTALAITAGGQSIRDVYTVVRSRRATTIVEGYDEIRNGGGGGYELPIASAETLGGIKVGSGLSINSETGVLSTTGGGGDYTAGDGIYFTEECIENFVTVAPGYIGVSSTECPLSHPVYRIVSVVCQPTTGSYSRYEYNRITNVITVHCDNVPEGTPITITYISTDGSNIINAEVGRWDSDSKTELALLDNYTRKTDYYNQWVWDGFITDDYGTHKVYKSNLETYDEESGNSYINFIVTGAKKIRVYIKQDCEGLDTNYAFAVIGRLSLQENSVGPDDWGRFNASHVLKGEIIPNYVSYDFNVSSGSTQYLQIAYHKDVNPDASQATAHKNARAYVYLVILDSYVGEKREIFNVYEDYGKNVASGSYSHAEGYDSWASGAYAHAEGYMGYALGSYSHAEGDGCRAMGGQANHAEGYYTVASGYESAHSEGYTTVASGTNSHSEGYNTRATNNHAHSEGGTTLAGGYASHAEGEQAQALGYANHAEGYKCIANGGDGAHAEGNYTEASKGIAPHAEGNYTKSTGSASHAEGWYSQATNTSAHSEGEYTVASGYMAHAEGDHTTASAQSSHAEGIYNTVSGLGSHVEGWMNEVSSLYAHVEGTRNKAIEAEAQHVEGSGNTATGHQSHVEGAGNIVGGEEGHTEGAGNYNISSMGHMEGSGNKSNTYATINHTEGAGNYNYGVQSHVEGSGNTLSGSHSHNEGAGNQIHGMKNHGEGGGNLAFTYGSHIEGKHNTVAGFAIHAEGAFNTVGATSASSISTYTFGANYAVGAIVGINNIYNPIDDESATPCLYRCITAPGQCTASANVTMINPTSWSDSTAYTAGAVVIYRRGMYSNNHIGYYYCRVDSPAGTLPTDGTYWTKIYNYLSPFKTTTSTGYYFVDPQSEIYGSAPIAHVTGTVPAMWEVINTPQSVHIEGFSNIALGNYQHVGGKFNVADANKAVIIGNGEDVNTRSNAYTLDWSGNATFAGDITVGTPLSTMAQTIGGAINELYQTGGGSVVSVTQKVSSGTNIADITVDDVTTSLYAPAPTEVTVSQVQSSGTEIASISVDGTSTSIYAPDAVGSVTVEDTLSEGTKVATITVDGVDTEILVPDAGDSVSVTQITSTGTHIADIEVDGVTTELYAPNGGGAVIDDTVIALDKTWSSSKINSELTSLADRIEAIERYLWGIPLITEDGYQRITEDGSERILEQEE